MPPLDYTMRFIAPDASPSAWYEPVTLAEAKAQCRVDTSDEDSLFELLLIPAARKAVEKRIDKLIGEQTWEVAYRWWPAWGVIELPAPLTPLQSVISLKYTDYDGVETVLYDSEASPPVDTGVFGISLYSNPGFLFLKPDQVLPTADLYPGYPIVLRVIAGIPLADVPENIKQEILIITGHLFEHREGDIPVPSTGLIDGEWNASY